MFSKVPNTKSQETRYETLPLPSIQGIVFEGGGVKGAVNLGVIESMTEARALESVKRVGGSSAGAVTALLVGLGFPIERIRKEVLGMDFLKFMDPIEGQKDHVRFILEDKKSDLVSEAMKTPNFGILKGAAFLTWAETLVTEALGKPNATFKELHDYISANPGSLLKDIYVTGSNITADRLETFSWETTPDMPIALAVRVSMSFPAAFEGVRYQLPGRDKPDLLVDGGVFSNYPIRMFDHPRYIPPGYEAYYRQTGINPSVVGVKVDNGDEIARVFWNIKAYNNIDALTEGATSPKTKLHKVAKADNYSERYGLSHLYGRSKLSNPMGGIKLTAHKSTTEEEADIRAFDSHRTIQVYDCSVPTLKLNIEENEILALRTSGRKSADSWFANYRTDATLAVLEPSKSELKFSTKKFSIEELLFFLDKNKQTMQELREGHHALSPDLLKSLMDELNEKCFLLEQQLLNRAITEIRSFESTRLPSDAESQKRSNPIPDSIFQKRPSDLSEREKEMMAMIAFTFSLHSVYAKEELTKASELFEVTNAFSIFPNPVTPDYKLNSEVVKLVNSSEFLTMGTKESRNEYKKLIASVTELESKQSTYHALKKEFQKYRDIPKPAIEPEERKAEGPRAA